MTQADLAVAAALSERTIRRLEVGERRTRRSTLERLVEAVAPTQPHAEREALLQELVGVAGPALAAESAYPERVQARRARRARKHGRKYVTRHIVLREIVAEGLLETHWHSRRTGRATTRDRQYQRLVMPDGSRRRVAPPRG